MKYNSTNSQSTNINGNPTLNHLLKLKQWPNFSLMLAATTSALDPIRIHEYHITEPYFYSAAWKFNNSKLIYCDVFQCDEWINKLLLIEIITSVCKAHTCISDGCDYSKSQANNNIIFSSITRSNLWSTAVTKLDYLLNNYSIKYFCVFMIFLSNY